MKHSSCAHSLQQIPRSLCKIFLSSMEWPISFVICIHLRSAFAGRSFLAAHHQYSATIRHISTQHPFEKRSLKIYHLGGFPCCALSLHLCSDHVSLQDVPYDICRFHLILLCPHILMKLFIYLPWDRVPACNSCWSGTYRCPPASATWPISQ